MNIIYKYPLTNKFRQSVNLPKGAVILDFNFQQKSPGEVSIYLWCLVDTEAELIPRNFLISGTGIEIVHNAENLKFIKTCHAPFNYVWHLFELVDVSQDNQQDENFAGAVAMSGAGGTA